MRWAITVVLLLVAVVARSILIGVAALAGFAAAEWSVRRQLRPYLTGPREVAITISDDQYATQGPDNATARPWSEFTSVGRVGGFWVLRLSPRAALTFPEKVLSNDETARFISVLRTHRLAEVASE